MLEKKFKGKKSDLQEKERNLCTKHIGHIQDLFWDIHFMRKPAQNIEPFDPMRIESHMRLSGLELTRWEYNLLMEMDLVFRATIMKNRG